MKILVYTGYDNAFKFVGDITSPNKFLYARKYDYEFLMTRDYRGFDRPISWYKIKKIRELLPYYDWIFWTDADSCIMNYDLSLDHLINNNFERKNDINISPLGGAPPVTINLPPLKEVNYIISEDAFQPCMGNFLIRNCEWSFRFLDLIYNQAQFINEAGSWDNRSQDFAIFNNRSLLENIKFLPSNYLNSPWHLYKDGDFLIHMYGSQNCHRSEFLFRFLTLSKEPCVYRSEKGGVKILIN